VHVRFCAGGDQQWPSLPRQLGPNRAYVRMMRVIWQQSETAALDAAAERKPPSAALHREGHAEWQQPVCYSGMVSAKDSSGDVAGHPTMTRNTSRTNSAIAISFQSVASLEFGHS